MRPRRSDSTATTLLPGSNTSPPWYATQSPATKSVGRPNIFSKLVLASASASFLVMRSPLSSAACSRASRLKSRSDGYETRRTHKASNRVLRACHASAIPIPTVTLCLMRRVMTVSSDKGGPGSIRWLSHEKGNDRELRPVYQQPISPYKKQRGLRGYDHSSVC